MKTIILLLVVNLCTMAQLNYTKNAEGWTDLPSLLVKSDGSRSFGNTDGNFNDSRDKGSKIVFFNTETGDNESAEAYWWNGENIIDTDGKTVDADGEKYGTNPLHPNEKAIKAFKYSVGTCRNAAGDPRLRSHNYPHFGTVSGGYPDWYLFRRGQTHDTFDGSIDGGRNENEPLVIASYGPDSDGRAIIDPATGQQTSFGGTSRDIVHPFSAHTHGDTVIWCHEVFAGLELHKGISKLGAHENCTSLGGGLPTLLIEDCKFVNADMVYLPIKTTVYRSISAFRWYAEAHNQGYYTSGFDAATHFDEVIFYKNGYKTDPLVNPDPVRDIFSRNVYEGGGSQMGHEYHNTIFADGASGSPQMRLGGRCDNSLIIEGYWFTASNSNSPTNTWLADSRQTGRSAIVTNNVQFIYKYPNPRDPDTDGGSSVAAQPGDGFSLLGAAFGARIENNIVSGAMLCDDLGFDEASVSAAYLISPALQEYQDGNSYTLKNDTLAGNIGYRTARGLQLQDDWTDVTGTVIKDNVFVCANATGGNSDNLSEADQLSVRDNRFYSDRSLPDQDWVGEGNTSNSYSDAAENENWPDPDRTLRRYVSEVLKLTLLDWQDEPRLDQTAVAVRTDAGEAYDPAGLKTFMAVATNMRKGGSAPAPSSGKPSWDGDYAWDARYTAAAVNDWVRDGFARDAAVHEPPVRRISSPSAYSFSNGNVRIFTINGRLLGTYESCRNAQKFLARGMYLVRPERGLTGDTHRLLVK